MSVATNLKIAAGGLALVGIGAAGITRASQLGADSAAFKQRVTTQQPPLDVDSSQWRGDTFQDMWRANESLTRVKGAGIVLGAGTVLGGAATLAGAVIPKSAAKGASVVLGGAGGAVAAAITGIILLRGNAISNHRDKALEMLQMPTAERPLDVTVED